MNPRGDENTVQVSRTSARTADTSPIILRTTKTSRLIFQPILLDNPHDPEAAIDGEFIFERKSPNGTWAKHNELPLSKLKATEWIRLELKACGVRKLGFMRRGCIRG